MIIFGLLKKEMITFDEGEPPRIKILQMPSVPKSGNEKLKVHYYERMFIKAINPDGTISKVSLQSALKTLIKTVARKLEGFSRPKSVAYYQRIIDRAHKQMLAAKTPNSQVQAFDKYIEWILLDKEYQKKMRPIDDMHVPYWYYYYFHPLRWRRRRYIPLSPRYPRGRVRGGRLLPTRGTRTRGTRVAPVSIPKMADSFVTSVESFANNMVTGFTGVANNIANIFVPPPPKPVRPRARRSSYSGRSFLKTS